MSPNMPEHRVGGDEVLEPERAKRPTVVGDQRDRDDLTGLWISEVADQGHAAEHGFSLGEGEFDPGDRVVLVRRG